VPESPVASMLATIDALDIDAFTALFAPDGRLLTVDGRIANGRAEVREVIGRFAADLRATNHRLTAEWHPEPDVWIAELDATYELTNYAQLGPYARAIVLHNGSGGIRELRIYGLHERPLIESTRGYQEVYGSGHWLPTL
jgi:SnoaL-like domain